MYSLKRPAYEEEMHQIIGNANVLNSSAVVYPCGKGNTEDPNSIGDSFLHGIKVRLVEAFCI